MKAITKDMNWDEVFTVATRTEEEQEATAAAEQEAAATQLLFNEAVSKITSSYWKDFMTANASEMSALTRIETLERFANPTADTVMPYLELADESVRERVNLLDEALLSIQLLPFYGETEELEAQFEDAKIKGTDFLYRGQSIMITGQEGVGKFTLMAQMCRQLNCGIDPASGGDIRPMKTVIISFEDTPAEYAGKVKSHKWNGYCAVNSKFINGSGLIFADLDDPRWDDIIRACGDADVVALSGAHRACGVDDKADYFGYKKLRERLGDKIVMFEWHGTATNWSMGYREWKREFSTVIEVSRRGAKAPRPPRNPLCVIPSWKRGLEETVFGDWVWLSDASSQPKAVEAPEVVEHPAPVAEAPSTSESPEEQALRLKSEGMSQRKISDELGKSVGWVNKIIKANE